MRILLLMLALAASTELHAQSVRVKRWENTIELRGEGGRLTTLVERYLADDLAGATVVLREFVSLAAKQSGVALLADNDVLVSFVATAPLAPAPTVATVLLPAKGDTLRKLPARLRGVKSVAHMYLADAREESIRLAWTSEPQENPLLTDLSKLAVLLATGVGQAVSAVSVEQASGPEATRESDALQRDASVFVIGDSISFPHKRAKLSLDLVVAGGKVNTAPLLAAIDNSSNDVALNTLSATSACARQTRTRLVASARHFLARHKGWHAPSILQTLHQQLRDTYQQSLSSLDCTTHGGDARAVDQPVLAQKVFEGIATLTNTAPRRIESKHTLVNAPSRFYGVGTVVGTTFARPEGDNYEVVSDRVVNRPLSGLLTSAVIHFHLPTDPTAFDVPTASNFTVFTGVVITPREGLLAGVSYLVRHRLGVQVSHAWMRGNSLRDGVVHGQTPPTDRSPFVSRRTGRFNMGFAVKL